MTNTNETIADIVAEMRGLVKPGETLDHTYELLNGLADRIEAVERQEVGNGAKIYEALKQILALAKARDLFEIQSIADTALAEPRRNCDVGTADEQFERHKEWCRRDIDYSHCCSDCRNCFARWAQMPYEEGGER